MKRYIDLWYCLIEALTDLQRIIYRNHYQKRYGSGWEKPFGAFLMSEANKKFDLLGILFWWSLSADLLLMTTALGDAYLFHHNQTKAFWLGLIVTVIILLPYYLWRRKNIESIIRNFRYDLSVSHFSTIKKIGVVLGIFFLHFPLCWFWYCLVR